MSPEAIAYVVREDIESEKVALDKVQFTVGRAPDNDLWLDDSEVSRYHARFTCTDSAVSIEDLDSTNGTFVNDAPISRPTELSDGDCINFAGVRLTFHISPGARVTEQLTPSSTAGGHQSQTPQVPQAALEGFGLPAALLERNETSLGRAVDNIVVLDDPAISSYHAAIYRHGDAFVVSDLGSANGTYVNGQRLTGERELNPGDEIRMGETLLTFRRLVPIRKVGGRHA